MELCAVWGCVACASSAGPALAAGAAQAVLRGGEACAGAPCALTQAGRADAVLCSPRAPGGGTSERAGAPHRPVSSRKVSSGAAHEQPGSACYG